MWLNLRRSHLRLLGALLLCQWLSAHAALPVLSIAEKNHLQQLGVVTVCVDPDWLPFEGIDNVGQHVGIAADLLTLVAQRTGVTLRLLKTQDWPESLAASRTGDCQILSLLNQTPERDEWLVFTQPILTDENILITREEHPFVVDLASQDGQTMVLPKGTSIEEHLRRDFPNLKLRITDTEAQALKMVSDRQADMTMRSLIVAAYTIKREGWFNLRIAGQVPAYSNQLRIGVVKGDAMLRDIMDKGVASITSSERQKIIDRHITINVTQGIDYALVKRLLAVLVLVMLTSLYWIRKLNQAKNLAEQTAAQQRQFISMLSHEVRTPLAVIDATVQVLQLQAQNAPDLLNMIGRIRRGAARLSYFFDNCLTADRIDSDNFTVHVTAVDIDETTNWAAENAGLLSGEHSLELDVEPDLPALWGDPVLLRIMLMNLLSNAFKYAPAHTSIHLRVRRSSDQHTLYMTVEDHGPGVPPDERELVFEKYQRGRLAEGKPGAGLGLAVVRRIANLHGGGVSLSCGPGQSTQFTVRVRLDAKNARTSKK